MDLCSTLARRLAWSNRLSSIRKDLVPITAPFAQVILMLKASNRCSLPQHTIFPVSLCQSKYTFTPLLQKPFYQKHLILLDFMHLAGICHRQALELDLS
jgi:hypothetical protein